MKKNAYLWFALCAVLGGCTLNDGMEFGEHCGDANSKPDYVVFNGGTCSLEQINDETNENCHQFARYVNIGRG